MVRIFQIVGNVIFYVSFAVLAADLLAILTLPDDDPAISRALGTVLLSSLAGLGLSSCLLLVRRRRVF